MQEERGWEACKTEDRIQNVPDPPTSLFRSSPLPAHAADLSGPVPAMHMECHSMIAEDSSPCLTAPFLIGLGCVNTERRTGD